MKLYDVKTVARFLDVSERRVRQLRDERVIEEVYPGLYDLAATTCSYIRYLRRRNSEGGEGLDYNAERAKLVRAKRRREEYELQREEGQLHTAADIEEVITGMLVNFKARLLAIPAKLAPLLCRKTERAEIFRLLKEQVDEALLELSDYGSAFDERGRNGETSHG